VKRPRPGPGRREIFMTIKQVAAWLQVSPMTVFRLVKRGEIPAFKIGRGWRFSLEELNKWVGRTRSPNRESPPTRGRSAEMKRRAASARARNRASRGVHFELRSRSAAIRGPILLRFLTVIAALSAAQH